MNRPLIALSALLIAPIASPSPAAILYYYAIDGTAEIDPTDGGSNPGGKIFGYNLTSNGKFFVDPTRTSAFPPPSQIFFENTANVIGDNDLTLQGSSAVIKLGKLFVTNVNSVADFKSNFTSRIYVRELGGGERNLPISNHFEIDVPEPGALTLAGLTMLTAIIRRRRPTR
jgi:MYXO-CTERM domain-containing protein